MPLVHTVPDAAPLGPVLASVYVTAYSYISGRESTTTTARIVGIGVESREGCEVWGMLNPPEYLGYLSRWSYGSDYAAPEMVVAQQREAWGEDHLNRWYLNAPTPGMDAFYVRMDDLVAAFRALGYDIPPDPLIEE